MRTPKACRRPAQGKRVARRPGLRPKQRSFALKGREPPSAYASISRQEPHPSHLRHQEPPTSPCGRRARALAPIHGWGILRDLDSPVLSINSVADHTHVLFNLNKNHALAQVIREAKRGSSKWLKSQGAAFGQFHWQDGYGAFSVSQSGVEGVQSYIAGQEEHHRLRTFRTEFRALVRRYQIPFDERYLWD